MNHLLIEERKPEGRDDSETAGADDDLLQAPIVAEQDVVRAADRDRNSDQKPQNVIELHFSLLLWLQGETSVSST